MAVHLKRAPWDDRSLCGRGDKSERTFDWEKCTCRLCQRCDLAFERECIFERSGT